MKLLMLWLGSEYVFQTIDDGPRVDVEEIRELLDEVAVVQEDGRMKQATEFPELNSLLEELVESVKEILADNFVGAYLVGSFAIGDATSVSDCDFLIPTRLSLSDDQEKAIRKMHFEISGRKDYWCQHLEGSYPPLDELRSLKYKGKKWLFLDNAHREMEWSTHCNDEVRRWTLREHGVALAGPDPTTIVDPVTAETLKAVMSREVMTFIPDLLSWISFDVAWTQRYAVMTLCRELHTISTGTIVSKQAALRWAKEKLDPRWKDLIEKAERERYFDFDTTERPRPGSVEQTLEFAEYAKELTAKKLKKR